MPIYTYECENCGERFEAKQSFNDAPLTVCPTCSEEKLYRVIQPVGIVFKGSGFYVTDSRGKQNLATTGTKKEDPKPSEGGNGSSSSTEGAPAKAETADKPASSTTTTETK
jgi:putative FmdB family regulatory protein